MSWNYRIVKEICIGADNNYMIAEVYYNKKEQPTQYCVASISFDDGGESLSRIPSMMEKILSRMQTACRKSILVFDCDKNRFMKEVKDDLNDIEGDSDRNKKKIDGLEHEIKDDIKAILDYFNLEFAYIPKTPEIPASLKLQPRKKNVKKVDK